MICQAAMCMGWVRINMHSMFLTLINAPDSVCSQSALGCPVNALHSKRALPGPCSSPECLLLCPCSSEVFSQATQLLQRCPLRSLKALFLSSGTELQQRSHGSAASACSPAPRPGRPSESSCLQASWPQGSELVLTHLLSNVHNSRGFLDSHEMDFVFGFVQTMCAIRSQPCPFLLSHCLPASSSLPSSPSLLLGFSLVSLLSL